MIPSVVSFLPRGDVAVGTAAVARRIIDGRNTLHSFKRVIGLGWFAKEVAEFRNSYGFDLERGEGGQPLFKTRAGSFDATELARHVFEWAARCQAPAAARRRIVVTTPVSFEPAQRAAITEAAHRAGLDHANTIDEPYAAVIPYLRRGDGEHTVAIYDLGGGTFDFAVLKVRGLVHRVLGSGGDPYLGGDDLDRCLADHVVREVLRTHCWDIRSSKESYASLVTECQKAKVRLSRMPEVQISLGLVEPVFKNEEITIDRPQLDAAIHDLVQGSFAVVDDVLREAGLVAQQIDRVILAGGSTYVPSVREAVRRYFGREPLAEYPPDHVIALGASMFASVQAGDRHSVVA